MLIKTAGKVVSLFALQLFLSFSLASRATFAQATLSRENAHPIVLTTLVTNDKGNFVTGLERDNFRVFIDKQPAEIQAFREEDLPLSVGIIFDTRRRFRFLQK
jgi:hypothetical protein